MDLAARVYTVFIVATLCLLIFAVNSVLREAGHDHGAVWRRIRESVLQAVTGIQPDVKRLMRLCVHDRQTCYEMFQVQTLYYFV